jgi:hypothetical protein
MAPEARDLMTYRHDRAGANLLSTMANGQGIMNAEQCQAFFKGANCYFGNDKFATHGEKLCSLLRSRCQSSAPDVCAVDRVTRTMSEPNNGKCSRKNARAAKKD